MSQEGAITVYLTMVFLSVVTLIFTTIESARIQASRMLIETSVDTGMESMLAGYQRELYDQYGVLFFDASFGYGGVTTSTIADKLTGYMDYQLHPTRGTYLTNSDFYKTTVEAVKLDKLALATDDGGKVFREQAVEYMRSRTGADQIKEWTGKYNWAVSNVQEGSDYKEKEQEVQESLASLEEEKAAIDGEKAEEARQAGGQKNPTAEVSTLRSMGILDLVYKDTSKVSQKSTDVSGLPSKRTVCKGTGLETYEDSVISNILFQLYLMEHFPHAASQNVNTDGNLQYQLEYLLIGGEHDIDNLKGVIHRLLLIREGANFAYLLTDGAKVAEAYTAATLLVGYTGLPPLIEATKYAILLSWAYAESIIDVRVLLAGEKVAPVKSAQTWKTSLAKIGEITAMDEKQLGDSTGMTYKEYLQMLLLVADQEETAMRALDLIELQMHAITGDDGICMDHYAAMLQVTVQLENTSVFLSLPFMTPGKGNEKKQMRITRRYGYDSW